MNLNLFDLADAEIPVSEADAFRQKEEGIYMLKATNETVPLSPVNYLGVRYIKKSTRWVAFIWYNGKYHYCGTWASQVEAMESYNEAARRLYALGKLSTSATRKLEGIPGWSWAVTERKSGPLNFVGRAELAAAKASGLPVSVKTGRSGTPVSDAAAEIGRAESRLHFRQE